MFLTLRFVKILLEQPPVRVAIFFKYIILHKYRERWRKMHRWQITFFLFKIFLLTQTYGYMNYSEVKFSFVEVDFSKFTGHSITVDGNYSDWRNLPYLNDNSSIYFSNEFIYKDPLNDDTGDGDYTYPTNSRFTQGMLDITEFRVTYDSNFLYFYIKLKTASPHPDGWWLNGIIIGINDETLTQGNYYLIEGDGINPDSGPCAEIRTIFKIQYTIFMASTYRIRMWDWEGKKIGDGDDPDNSDGSLNNLKVKAGTWNIYEAGIPLSLLNIKNKKIRFLAGSCFEENQMVREVQGYPLLTEWYITGGDRYWWNNLSSDPDVIDLIGADKYHQEQDLSSYENLFIAEQNFENFNVTLSSSIFSPSKGEDLIIYFTPVNETVVSIYIKDLEGEIVKTIIENKIVKPESSFKTVEYHWNGTDYNNKEVKRGIFLIEVIFKQNNKFKITRKVVRVW